MRASVPAFGLHANHTLDLSRIDAIGFDLDHTLALYDDHALNLLAAAETVPLLAQRIDHAVDHFVGMPTDHVPAVRTLALDLRHGAIVKMDASGRVRMARRRHRWMDEREIQGCFESPDAGTVAMSPVHSPFDIPVLWFFEYLASVDGDAVRPLPELARDIRRMLDVTHTRGLLKSRVVSELHRFVFPAGNVLDLLHAWSNAGRRLFVVTNSHRDYAERVLDAVIGPAWRTLFDGIVVDANKPAFFEPGSGKDATSHRTRDRVVVMEHARASDVDAWLATSGERVLYVGDNLHTDIIAARAFGWRTALVVPELGASDTDAPWGGLLAHDGSPTRFSRELLEHADLVCDRVDSLLDAPLRGVLTPRTDFLARIGCRDSA